MANNSSVTDPEAVSNVTVVPDATPATEVKSQPSTKQDMTAVQVDTKPDESVDMADFLAVKDGIPAAQKQVETKVEPKVDDKKPSTQDKPVLEKPLEAKPVAQDIKVDDKKSSDKAAVVDDKTDARDYSDIPENLKPIFKKLHNEPFNTFKPVIKELETTKAQLKDTETKLAEAKKGGLPNNYYEHQRGYILAPEFETAANTAIKAEQIANHWKSQADRIRKGETTYQDVNVNPRTGELSLSDPMQVTKDTEAKVDRYVEWAAEQLREKQYSVRSLAEKHAVTHKEAVTQVTDFENTAFKVFGGENAKQWEPIVKDTVMKTFPPAFRSNPLATGYAKALLTIGRLGEMIKTLQANGGKVPDVVKTDDGKVINLEDKKKAGPSAADMANAGKTDNLPDDDNITMDDFKKAKEEVVYYRR